MRTIYETEIATRYEEIIEHDRVKVNKYVSRSQKFLLQTDIKMIVPHEDVMKTFEKLHLPVYRINRKMKCHFRDVVKRLCKFALV